MNKCLFLDRDGVINIDYGHVYKEKDFVFRKEIFDICQEAQYFNFKIIVITNQAGIGRGLYTENDFIIINNYMKEKFHAKGIDIDDVYFCPFHPTKGKGIYLKKSYDRKPNPGLILKAEKDHNINLKNSIMIGDKETDKKAAKKAGIKFYIDAKLYNWNEDAIKIIRKLI